MAVTKRKDRKGIYIYFRPFGKLICLRLDVATKSEARLIEGVILRACRTGDFSGLDIVVKEAAIRMFSNQRWELPEALAPSFRPVEKFTLWRAVEAFMEYPEIVESKGKWRYSYSLADVVAFFGKGKPLKSITIPDLKSYQVERQRAGAAPASINRDLSTLSKLFGVMIELQHVEANPCQHVKALSTKASERQVYLSFTTVEAIAGACPEWFRPMIWTAFFTGARRGEILGLTRKQVNLSGRMIVLTSADTKEGHWKRIPIHRNLVPVLENAMRVSSLATDKVFCLRKGDTVTELNVETFKNPWERACEKLKLDKPRPRFHDLRHTWKTNARRSGMHPEIEKAIMGHSERGRSVHEMYGRISGQELLKAIDQWTHDHGQTEIWVAGNVKESPEKNVSQVLASNPKNQKGHLTG